MCSSRPVCAVAAGFLIVSEHRPCLQDRGRLEEINRRGVGWRRHRGADNDEDEIGVGVAILEEVGPFGRREADRGGWGTRKALGG